jgi:hypothetical protein
MSTQHGPLVSGPRECGNGDGNGNVDANLAGFDVAFKVAGCGAVVGEDGGTVSVYAVVRISGGYEDGEEGRTFVTVDEVDGFLQRLDVDPGQNRSKDLDSAPCQPILRNDQRVTYSWQVIPSLAFNNVGPTQLPSG